MRVRLLFGFMAAACLAACWGCGPHPPTTTRQDDAVLSGAPLDAIDLAIFMYVQRSALNPITPSVDLKQRLSKYGKGTTFEISTERVFQTLDANGARLTIPSGGEFRCRFQGGLTYTVTLKDGEVGVIDGSVFVAEKTRATVDADEYEFRGGKWRKVN